MLASKVTRELKNRGVDVDLTGVDSKRQHDVLLTISKADRLTNSGDVDAAKRLLRNTIRAHVRDRDTGVGTSEATTTSSAGSLGFPLPGADSLTNSGDADQAKHLLRNIATAHVRDPDAHVHRLKDGVETPNTPHL